MVSLPRVSFCLFSDGKLESSNGGKCLERVGHEVDNNLEESFSSSRDRTPDLMEMLLVGLELWLPPEGMYPFGEETPPL